MTAVITLYCNGNADSCTTTLTVTGGTPNDARAVARAGGWKTSRPQNRDYCPQCIAAGRASRRQPCPAPLPAAHRGACRTCGHHPRTELREMLGHDPVGHAAANVLARYQITDLTTLRAFTDQRLRGMSSLGKAGYLRVQYVRRTHPPHTAP